MKKDRNCGGTMPMYNMGMTGQFPVMPLMPIPNTMPYQNQTIPYQNMNYQTDNQSDISARLSNLEKRISTLEGIINSNNSYNTSNYQMM